MELKISDQHTKPMIRVFIMLVGLLCVLLISWSYTGSPIPEDPKYSLVFQNALLLIVLGSAILEHFFTKPADSMVNSLMAGITLFSVYGNTPTAAWWTVFIYCLFVFVISTVCVATSGERINNELAEVVNSRLYRPAVVLGRARVIFSIVFLFGIYSFYSSQTELTVTLVVFWGIFMAIWPLKIPQLLSAISFNSSEQIPPVGRLLRVDNPGILRFSITEETNWGSDSLFIYQRVDNSQKWVMPLYSHFDDVKRIGTAMIVGDVKDPITGCINGCIYDLENNALSQTAIELLGEDKDTRFVGFIVENSKIERIKFEIKSGEPCTDGMLVWCRMNGEKVYYQISYGLTYEEDLDGDKHGYQIAYASQLGTLDDAGFHKFDWLPEMNAPVFAFAEVANKKDTAIKDNEFLFGYLPKTSIAVTGDFIGNFNFHTAIIGVTGSGKTELGFDIIRHAVSNRIKTICIDLTSQYQGRLSDLNPSDLSITQDTATKLGEKLFDVETGSYGAGAEKKALKEFSDKLRQEVDKSIREFMEDESAYLGLIQLPEISNSQASIYITEIYMSCLLNIAKENYGNASFKALVTVEEAHTVMPESATMGVSDFASKGLVARIAQIALQGRKYNVGLLVLAQRTANVSKTILTQCNSIISFACYDDTSIGFLRNVFGTDAAEMVPNLKQLQAVIFGKIVKSERPIVVDIPFDKNKVS